MNDSRNRYSRLIENVFFKNYKQGDKEVAFVRDDLILAAKELDITLPKNLGDVIYSFRYRAGLPESIVSLAPEELEWVIRPAGRSRYMFSLSSNPRIAPNQMLAETKIPDATPGIIKKYALNDEQGLLAKLRYNRLIDIFIGITCFSLQNHLRTTVPDMGQIETDELYVGLDKKGIHYILPIQAKGGTDQLGIVQIEQDSAMCLIKYPNLICIPIAAQFIEGDLIALFSFESSEKGMLINCEKHYRLVEPDSLSSEEIIQYRKRQD